MIILESHLSSTTPGVCSSRFLRRTAERPGASLFRPGGPVAKALGDACGKGWERSIGDPSPQRGARGVAGNQKQQQRSFPIEHERQRIANLKLKSPYSWISIWKLIAYSWINFKLKTRKIRKKSLWDFGRGRISSSDCRTRGFAGSCCSLLH